MQKASVCPLDCPDTCSLSVTVEHDRVVAVRGSEANPVTGGAICAKVGRYYPAFVHGPNRLRYPLRRRGAKGGDDFERIGWDQALDLIVERVGAAIARHGAQTVLPFNYAGPHGKLAADAMSMRFFNRLGASRLLRRPLCGGVRGEAYLATFGAVPGTPLQQAEAAELIVVWGNNASVCNLHLLRYVNRARRNGAKLVVIDPRRTKIAEQADLHLPVRPGSDVALALALAGELAVNGGLAREFVDRHVLGADDYLTLARDYPKERAAAVCGVPAEAIRTLADWYRDASPALISLGVGLERNRNGGAGVRAILALPALAGKFGVVGGGVIAGDGHAFPATPARLERPDLLPAHGDGEPRTFNILDVSSALLDTHLAPPLDALFIYNHNPVIVHPDQNRMKRALAREDLFTVGIDVAFTDSMRYADVILPACSHFEHHDIFAAYGQQFLQRAEPVIPPVGESLPNTEIFRRLAARFGFDDAAFGDDDPALMDAAFDPDDPRLGGRRPSRLPTDRALPMQVEGRAALLFDNVWPATPSGRIELVSAALERRYGQRLPSYRVLNDDPAFPLTLLSPASERRTSSTFGGVVAENDQRMVREAASGADVGAGGKPRAGMTGANRVALPALTMHPTDADARGLSDGDRVRVWNAGGEVWLTLTVCDSVRPGVVSSDKGAWFASSPNRQTVSALAPAHKADLADGACYNDARVEVAAG